MSYVPTTDLLNNVTYVSRGLEEVARGILLSRQLVELTPTNMADYLDTANVRSNHHKRVVLSKFNFQNMPPEESTLLETFTSSAAASITELHLDYFPHEKISPQILSLLTNSPKLRSVNFSPDEFHLEMLKPLVMLPKWVKFPSVVKLGFHLPTNLYLLNGMAVNIARNISRETIHGILSLFPKLKIFQGVTFRQDLVEYFLSGDLPFEEVSLRLDNSNPDRPLSIVPASLFLTRLEFQIDTFNRSTDHYAILAAFADRLEKMKISEVDVIPSKFRNLMQATTITLPEVFPKLKCLEIWIGQNNFRDVAGPTDAVALNLKFSESGANVADYSKQFPALETLVVSRLDYLDTDEEKKEWLEISAGFLYKYFLHGESRTMRDIRVELPPKNVERFKLLRHFKDNAVFEVVDSCDFFRKILTTFPNLKPRWAIYDRYDVEGGAGAGGGLKKLEGKSPEFEVVFLGKKKCG